MSLVFHLSVIPSEMRKPSLANYECVAFAHMLFCVEGVVASYSALLGVRIQVPNQSDNGGPPVLPFFRQLPFESLVTSLRSISSPSPATVSGRLVCTAFCTSVAASKRHLNQSHLYCQRQSRWRPISGYQRSEAWLPAYHYLRKPLTIF